MKKKCKSPLEEKNIHQNDINDIKQTNQIKTHPLTLTYTRIHSAKMNEAHKHIHSHYTLKKVDQSRPEERKNNIIILYILQRMRERKGKGRSRGKEA